MYQLYKTVFLVFLVFLCVFSFVFLPFSCKKETPAHYTQFPIELTATDVTDGVQLSWTKIETSDFIDYKLVSSTTDSIPDFDLLAQNPKFSILATIPNGGNPSFIDPQNMPLARTKTYYRVFARLQGRVLASKNIVTSPNVLALGGFFNQVISNYSTETPRFYMSSAGGADCAVLDAKMETIKKGVFDINNTGSLRTTLASKNGENEEIAAIDQGNKVAFNDAISLKSLQSKAFSSSTPLAIGGTSDGFFILITDEINNNVKCISVGTHAVLSESTVRFGFTIQRGSILVKNPADREFILRDPITSTINTRVVRFRYNEQGQISEIINVLVPNTITFPILTISPDGAFAIVNNSLLNRALSVQKNIGSDNIGFYINLKNDKLYAILEEIIPGSSREQIDEYSFPSLTKLRTIDIKINATHCFVVNDKLYVFGNSAVQKIKL